MVSHYIYGWFRISCCCKLILNLIERSLIKSANIDLPIFMFGWWNIWYDDDDDVDRFNGAPHALWVLLWQNAQFAQTFVCCDGFRLAWELVILTECNYLLNDSVGNILIRFASIKDQHLNEYAWISPFQRSFLFEIKNRVNDNLFSNKAIRLLWE